MKHVMYTTAKLNFIHSHGKGFQAGKGATISLWNDELGCYIHKDCREFAAKALRMLRKKGVKLERTVVTK